MDGWVALWSGLFALVVGFGTWLCLTFWDRRIAAEEAVVQRLVQAREAAARSQAEAERRVAEEIASSERRHRALTEAAAIALWLAGPDGRITGIEGWAALTGQPAEAVGRGEAEWLEALHPEDRARAAAAWAAAVAGGAGMDVEYRVRTPFGDWRWCRARAVPVRTPAGEILEWVGVVEDIDARRSAEEGRQLLSREVNHRAKNLLAVVQSIVAMTRAGDARAFAAAVNARIAALARAHTLLAEGEWRGAELRSVAEREFGAFAGLGGQAASVGLVGGPMALAALAVQPLAMLLHELATNAAKYGSLSAGGTVLLEWWEEGASLRLRWTEAGGPPLDAPPARAGFGSRMIDALVEGQLGGRIERHWRPAGLVCDIALPLARTTAPAGVEAAAA